MNEHETAKKQAQEKMLETLFEYAASCHIDNLIEATTHLEVSTDSELALSPEFDQKMKKIIESYNKKDKIKNFREKTIRFLPKAAVFLLIVIGSLTMVVASVEALRVKVINFFVNTHQKYTDVQLRENSPDQLNEQIQQMIPIQHQIPSDWDGYVLGYVPQGFNVVGTEEDSTSKTINYADQNGKTIRFTQYLSNATNLRIDTENAIVEHHSIHNSKAILAEKDGRVSIVWENEYLFYIVGKIDKSEIKKMAESVFK